MNNFIIDTPDNFWQIRWLDKYMEGHKGFIAGGCFKNILSGEKNLMNHYMDELNKAFAYVSASPLSSTWYWSSTESSQAVAWYVVFSNGLTGTGNKHIGDMVRAVIDF